MLKTNTMPVESWLAIKLPADRMHILVYLKLIDAAELWKHRNWKDFLGDKKKSP
ncbi:MAG: hypothetical protein ACHQFX_05505 [Chitinophagales bacterium]